MTIVYYAVRTAQAFLDRSLAWTGSGTLEGIGDDFLSIAGFVTPAVFLPAGFIAVVLLWSGVTVWLLHAAGEFGCTHRDVFCLCAYAFGGIPYFSTLLIFFGMDTFVKLTDIAGLHIFPAVNPLVPAPILLPVLLPIWLLLSGVKLVAMTLNAAYGVDNANAVMAAIVPGVVLTALALGSILVIALL